MRRNRFIDETTPQGLVAPRRGDPGGVILALLSYGMWGFIPIYFKQLVHFTPGGILAGRIVSSVVLLWVVLGLLGKLVLAYRAMLTPSLLRMLTCSALLLSANWLLFIFGVLQGEIRQCSLGYFINPLLTVLLGAWVFHEPLRGYHRLSLGLAGLGILTEVVQVGGVPWIALGLAVSFAGYALVRRTSPVDALTGLAVEATVLLPLALIYLAVGPLARAPLQTVDGWIMAGSGIVTALPLLCYVSAARRITFVALGFLQYLAPSLQLCVAVYGYGEPFPRERAISFALIWISVAVFLLGTAWQRTTAPSSNPTSSNG